MYDIIVVGAGHAGIDIQVLLVQEQEIKHYLLQATFSNAGSMPCNTSIGGPAKGIIVREIDALGDRWVKLQMRLTFR